MLETTVVHDYRGRNVATGRMQYLRASDTNDTDSSAPMPCSVSSSSRSDDPGIVYGAMIVDGKRAGLWFTGKLVSNLATVLNAPDAFRTPKPRAQ